MKMKEKLNDLQAFAAVASDRSFTKAAARLGVSRSSLSHAMLGLEERVGVRLLHRTTRSVSTTAAGARLLRVLSPRLEEIEAELASLRSFGEKPAGSIRITANDHAIATTLWPRLLPLLQEHPDISIEFSMGYELTDIVAERFDAGVRVGDQVNKDMIAVRITPDIRMAVVAASHYMDKAPPITHPDELVAHNCIALRLPTYGGLYTWEFEKDGKEINVRVNGQTVFNNTFLMIQAARDGMGLAYVPYDTVEAYINTGELVPLLTDWCPKFPGYYLYYSSRRQLTRAFELVIEALRWHTR
ncbi:LysR family transcriptional regulator [Dickeya oryzae]|uniref:LysR family transcriptional regulator n=1 Tax=Dickeya oryzae TaxID=1240404 RepID=UPI002096EA98|nr:LysR family transcriptional regulator [Dickeya oryzae]MCO7255350.1 LysR family transcriptional regulator [Dickeya oryzae]